MKDSEIIILKHEEGTFIIVLLIRAISFQIKNPQVSAFSRAFS